MSKIIEALNFLKKDLKNAQKQWTDGKQFESLLQRESVTVEGLDLLFDPADDEAAWASEYAKPDAFAPLTRLYRQRIAFLKDSRKEFHEDYDPEVSDVDFMRLLEVPYTDPEYVIDWSIGELED